MRADPHHFMPTKGGHSRPPLFGFRVTSLDLLDSPMPQDLLQGLHSVQEPTLQLTGCSENINIKFQNSGTFSLESTRHLLLYF